MKFSKTVLMDYNLRNYKLNNPNWTRFLYSQFISKKTFINHSSKNYSIYQFTKLSENFIRKYQNEIDWDCISIYQKLSENFIRELQNKVDWNYISIHQKLSENFIREFQNKVNWYYIFICQNLSIEFIIEFINKIDINWLKDNKYISKENINFIIQRKRNQI